jgi:hypothetical protein
MLARKACTIVIDSTRTITAKAAFYTDAATHRADRHTMQMVRCVLSLRRSIVNPQSDADRVSALIQLLRPSS